jgi:hypothetical protein
MRRLIGFLVFVVGFAAIIAAGWLAFKIPPPHG